MSIMKNQKVFIAISQGLNNNPITKGQKNKITNAVQKHFDCIATTNTTEENECTQTIVFEVNDINGQMTADCILGIADLEMYESIVL